MPETLPTSMEGSTSGSSAKPHHVAGAGPGARHGGGAVLRAEGLHHAHEADAAGALIIGGAVGAERQAAGVAHHPVDHGRVDRHSARSACATRTACAT